MEDATDSLNELDFLDEGCFGARERDFGLNTWDGGEHDRLKNKDEMVQTTSKLNR